MEFNTLAKNRYSTRRFNIDKKVEKEKIDMIIEAGYVAPTAGNKQPQRVLVLEDSKSLDLLKQCTNCHFNAPLAMIICYEKDQCWVREYDLVNSGVVDASIVATHMMLQAFELGIGSTWVMHYNPNILKQVFEIPDHIESVAILVMGYPREDDHPSPRHQTYADLDHLVHYEHFTK